MNEAFLSCGPNPLGLYPIVDSYSWVKTLIDTGVSTLQLRIKQLQGEALAKEVAQSIALTKQQGVRLFINDYWELALQYDAYGVHLGQEDLVTADLPRLQQAGLRLGISTHSIDEIVIAQNARPSYLAFGPVFPTTTKVMAFGPQGLAALNHWREQLTYPLVAIGGINLENIAAVAATKVSGIAMISAITQAKDPRAATKALLEILKKVDIE